MDMDGVRAVLFWKAGDCSAVEVGGQESEVGETGDLLALR